MAGEPKLKKPTFLVELDDEDITEKVEKIRFRDKLHGSSSDLRIVVSDPNFEWLDEQKPKKNQKIRVELGYKFTETILPSHGFEVDSIGLSLAMDEIEIQCQQTPLTKKLREKRDETYEDTSLKAIAQKIAERNDLEIKGEIDDVDIETANQNDQTDLAFIKKLADDWGQIVKLDRKQGALVFNSWEKLETADPQFTLSRKHLRSGTSFDDSMAKTYKAAEVKYRDGDKKKTITYKVEAGEIAGQAETNKDDEEGKEKPDTLKINTRVENEEQARRKAKEALRKQNKEAVKGRIDTEGNWVFRGGINFILSGFGPRFDGVWQLDQPVHTVSKSGSWSVSSDCRRLRSVSEEEG